MFTKIHQDLAKPVYEAIPKIAERTEKKCPNCKGLKWRTQGMIEPMVGAGKRVPCHICNGIGKVKGKWEWKPQKGGTCCDDCDVELLRFTRVINGVKGDKILVTGWGDNKLGWSNKKDFIPLLHWEDHLEPILEGFGWVLWDMKRTVPSSDGTGSLVVVKLAKGGSVRRGQGKDRQEAFQRAILALVEELK